MRKYTKAILATGLAVGLGLGVSACGNDEPEKLGKEMGEVKVEKELRDKSEMTKPIRKLEGDETLKKSSDL